MFDEDDRLQLDTYNWTQNEDQVIISFLVPESTKSKDLDILIEKQYLKAGIKGKEPVFQAKLYQPIFHNDSNWRLDKNSLSPLSSISSSPIISIASSTLSSHYSPNSSMVLPDIELLQSSFLASDSDCPPSPRLIETPPTFQSKKMKNKTVTIYLEKEDMIEWVIPIAEPTDKNMDVTSSFLLGQWFEVDLGDLSRALIYYLLAAEKGNVQAMLKVAAIYELNYENQSEDRKKAFEWYKRAADIGSPLACYVVAMSYYQNIEKDDSSALYYYNRCMSLTAPRIDIDFESTDHMRDCPPQTRDERYFCSAAFQTGIIYLNGSRQDLMKAVDKNPELAVQYWKEASILGHAQSSYNIGIVYANGIGVERDNWLAGKWFGRALALDSTLKVPTGISIVDWNSPRPPEEKKVPRKRKRKSKPAGDDIDVTVVAILGSIFAIIGAVWFLYGRGKRSH